jgi:hypothetical protein
VKGRLLGLAALLLALLASYRAQQRYEKEIRRGDAWEAVLERSCEELHDALSCYQLGLWLRAEPLAGPRELRLMIGAFSHACAENLSQACASRDAARAEYQQRVRGGR